MSSISHQAPTLRYRQGNPNQVRLGITSGGAAMLPSTSLVISAELRMVEGGKVLTTITLLALDASLSGGSVPDLPPGHYLLGLLFHYPATPSLDYRVGVANLLVFAKGSLETVADADTLSVSINTVQQVISAQLDNSPTAQLAAQSAAQAQAALDGLIDLMAQQGNTQVPAPDFANTYQLFKQV